MGEILTKRLDLIASQVDRLVAQEPLVLTRAGDRVVPRSLDFHAAVGPASQASGAHDERAFPRRSLLAMTATEGLH